MQSVITAQSRASPASSSAALRRAQLVRALQRGDAEAGRLGAGEELGGASGRGAAPPAPSSPRGGRAELARGDARSRRRSNSRSPAGAGCRAASQAESTRPLAWPGSGGP